MTSVRKTVSTGHDHNVWGKSAPSRGKLFRIRTTCEEMEGELIESMGLDVARLHLQASHNTPWATGFEMRLMASGHRKVRPCSWARLRWYCCSKAEEVNKLHLLRYAQLAEDSWSQSEPLFFFSEISSTSVLKHLTQFVDAYAVPYLQSAISLLHSVQHTWDVSVISTYHIVG